MRPDTGNFPHYLIKEIHETPRAVRDTMTGRVDAASGRVLLGEIRIGEEQLRSRTRIVIAASGTSRHAGLAAKYMIEQLAQVPVEVDHASEFEYRNPIAVPGQLTILITQSGETVDTLAAQRITRARGSKTLVVCNVVGSGITREADGVIYTHAGVEVSIASTKAFTAQLVALLLFGLYLAQVRGTISSEEMRYYVDNLMRLPGLLETVLARDAECELIAQLFASYDDFLYLGRGVHFPIALDGALKLKEISYIHAEGYPAGEMKHGPSALIDHRMPLVFIATVDRRDEGSVARSDKTLANLKDVKARGATVIALATEGDHEVRRFADHVIYIPRAPELLSPVLEIVPLQMLAYHIAVKRGCDVDRPRNLVKSVTSE